MPIFYKLEKKMNPLKPGDKEKYYAKTVAKGKIDIHYIAKEISLISSVWKPDTFRVFMHISEIVKSKLAEGYTVELLNLAVFSPSIHSEGIENPKYFHQGLIKKVKVNVRAKKGLNLRMADASLQRIKTGHKM